MVQKIWKYIFEFSSSLDSFLHPWSHTNTHTHTHSDTHVQTHIALTHWNWNTHRVQGSAVCLSVLTTLKELCNVQQQPPGNPSCSKSHIINFWSNWGYFPNGWNLTPYFQPLVSFFFSWRSRGGANAASLRFLFVASQRSCLKTDDEICIERRGTKTIKPTAVWSGRMAGWERRM